MAAFSFSVPTLSNIIRTQIVLCLTVYASATFYDAVADNGKVSNHSQPFAVFPAKTAGTCGIECERSGKYTCRAFNIKQTTDGRYICELFHRKSHRMSDLQMLESPNGRYFEMRCDGVALRTGVKDIIDEQEIVTMIGEDQNVYQQRSGQILSLLGTVTEIFDGFEHEAMDMTSTIVDPLGRIHLIRTGKMLYCFIAVGDLVSFRDCQVPMFPMDIVTLFQSSESDASVTDYKYIITYDVHKLVKVLGNLIKITINSDEESVKSGDLNVKLATTDEFSYLCGDSNVTDTYGFCDWVEYWSKGSGGVFLSPTRVCLFARTYCYIFDFEARAMMEYYQICKNEFNRFLV